MSIKVVMQYKQIYSHFQKCIGQHIYHAVAIKQYIVCISLTRTAWVLQGPCVNSEPELLSLWIFCMYMSVRGSFGFVQILTLSETYQQTDC